MKLIFLQVLNNKEIIVTIRSFVIILLILFIPLFIQAQDEILATLIINGKIQAEILGQGEYGFVYFSEESLRPFLAGQIDSEIIDALFAGRAGISPEDLSVFGISGRWDPNQLVLVIDIPPNLSPKKRISIITKPLPPTGVPVKSEPFSALLNLNLQTGFDTSLGYLDFPSSLNSELFINIWSWVFETGAALDVEAGVVSIELTRARLVKDFPARDLRLTAGWIDIPSTGFQSSQRLIGLALQNKNFDESLRRSLSGLEKFALRKKADVRVYLNGILIRTINLDPGVYSLSDLPFTSGINNLLVVVEEEGEEPVQYIQNITHEDSILGKGNIDYGVSLGLEDQKEPGVLGTGFIRFGITEQIDSGLYFQLGLKTFLMGALGVFATDFGSFTLEPALSIPSSETGFPAGYGISSRYRLSFPGRSNLPSLGLSLQYLSTGFTTPRSVYQRELPPAILRLAGQVAMTLPGGFGISISAEMRNNLDKDLNSYFGTLTLQKRIGQGLTMTALGTLEKQATGDINPGLTISLISSPPGTGRNTYFSQDIDTGNSYFDLTSPIDSTKNTEMAVRGRNILGAEDDPSSLNVYLHRKGKIGDLGGSFFIVQEPEEEKPYANLRVSLGSSLAFSGGIFALSRPISDSFVILAPGESLYNQRVNLRLQSGGNDTVSFMKKRGITQISSYRKIAATLDLPEAPPDQSPDMQFLVLEAGYRSGIVLRPKLSVSYAVFGRLFDESGVPVPWALGTIFLEDGSRLSRSFTDSEGRFEFYDLKPGLYTVNWEGTNRFSFVLELTDSSPLITDLGDLQIQPEKKETEE